MTSTDEDADFWASLESGDDSGELLQGAIEAASDDEVVCRVCAAPFGQVTQQHVQTHGMTLEEYRREHPEAPIYPDAPERRPGREIGFRQSEETKCKISRAMKKEGDGDGE